MFEMLLFTLPPALLIIAAMSTVAAWQGWWEPMKVSQIRVATVLSAVATCGYILQLEVPRVPIWSFPSIGLAAGALATGLNVLTLWILSRKGR